MTKKHVFALIRDYPFEGALLEGVFTTAHKAICHVRDMNKTPNRAHADWILHRCTPDTDDTPTVWSWDSKRPPDPKVEKARVSTS